MTDPRTQLVGRGYDKIGDRFTEWRDRIVGDPRREWEEELVGRLQDGARVLELGCGAGVPDTQRLGHTTLIGTLARRGVPTIINSAPITTPRFASIVVPTLTFL